MKLVRERKKKYILQAARIIIQLIFFILLPALYIGALNGVKQIYIAVIEQNISMALLPQLIELFALIPVTIFLGRFFCGWMCGFGFFSDLIYRFSKKVFRTESKINEKTDALLKSLKYIILAVIIIAVWSLDVSVLNSASPWDVFGMLFTVGKASAVSFVLKNFIAGFVLLILITVASLLVERFFCRYLCPMGAIFAVVSKLRVLRIKKPSAQCGRCRVCTNACPMGIPLYKAEDVKSGECINCMKCVGVCLRGNAAPAAKKSRLHPLAIALIAVAAVAGIYYAGFFMTGGIGSEEKTSVNSATTASEYQSDEQIQASSAAQEQATEQATEQVQTEETESRYIDGTYHGSGSGFRGTTEVTVEVKNGKISSITVDSYRDDKKFFIRAFDTIVERIIGSQSAEVDAVSGATFSSEGIKKAVADALRQATK
jgi:polyferredoxin/major membrane immunogen (membrane-anchored lipoprotein)